MFLLQEDMVLSRVYCCYFLCVFVLMIYLIKVPGALFGSVLPGYLLLPSQSPYFIIEDGNVMGAVCLTLQQHR